MTHRSRAAALLAGAAAAVLLLPATPLLGPLEAQTLYRRVVTLHQLAEYPFFFHGREVTLAASAVADNVLTYLVDGTHRLLLLDVPLPS